MNTTLQRLPPRTPMEIFRFLPEGTLVELINKTFVLEPSPTYVHQSVVGELHWKMKDFVEKHGLGKVLIAPFDVYLDNENAFQPDILFVDAKRTHLFRNDGLYGAPDLIVEILSPSTSRYDRKDKKEVYECCGVKEYWLVDPVTCRAEGFYLAEGAFRAFPPAEGIIRSVLLGGAFEF